MAKKKVSQSHDPKESQNVKQPLPMATPTDGSSELQIQNLKNLTSLSSSHWGGLLENTLVIVFVCVQRQLPNPN